MGWRCSPCGITWPDEPDLRVRVLAEAGVTPLAQGYENCAQCGQPCESIREEGIDPDTAHVLKLYCEFERYCENRPPAPVQSIAA